MSSTLSVGDLVTYTTLDIEAYSRGYGIHYESKGSTIVSICYKMANGDMIEAKDVLCVVEKPPQSKSEDPKTLQNGSPG